MRRSVSRQDLFFYFRSRIPPARLIATILTEDSATLPIETKSIVSRAKYRSRAISIDRQRAAFNGVANHVTGGGGGGRGEGGGRSKPASLMRSRARRRRRRVGRARERNNRINCRDYFDARAKCRLMLHLQHAHRHTLSMYYAIAPPGRRSRGSLRSYIQVGSCSYCQV